MAKVNPVQYLRDVRQEVARVTWPTRKETLITTGLVLALSALAAPAGAQAQTATQTQTQSRDPVAEMLTKGERYRRAPDSKQDQTNCVRPRP